MIAPAIFLEALHEQGIRFFAGVPDSLMKGLLTCIQENEQNHFITADEGAAVAMATGYHLATGRTGLVYLQNSGLGNLINPITSLANRDVYGIPLLLLIGWRGQAGKKDEPQHQMMGRTTLQLLEVLDIPHDVLSPGCDWQSKLSRVVADAREGSRPAALVVEENFFSDQELLLSIGLELSAAGVIDALYEKWTEDTIVVCTTGKIGRLFYAINGRKGGRIKKFFLNVGAMGHASSIALGLARFSQDPVVLLDGDGSLLMHMGSLAIAGQLAMSNLQYVLLNNGAHQSVGGQPTAGFHVDFCAVARACGFKNSKSIQTQDQLKEWASAVKERNGFIEFRINTSMPDNLPRPAESFAEAKQQLMKAIQSQGS